MSEAIAALARHVQQQKNVAQQECVIGGHNVSDTCALHVRWTLSINRRLCDGHFVFLLRSPEPEINFIVVSAVSCVCACVERDYQFRRIKAAKKEASVVLEVLEEEKPTHTHVDKQ